MKGWDANFESDMWKHKQQLLMTLSNMDMEADLGGFSEQQWRIRYLLEKELLAIYAAAEIYWQKRGGSNGCWRETLIQPFFIKVLMAERGNR